MSIFSLTLRRAAVSLSAVMVGVVSWPGVSSPASAATPATSNWVLAESPSSSPSARHDASMVYDAATHTTLLFGGYNGSYLADTWSWNGSTWSKLSPATSPVGLRGASMVFDPITNNVVLFGGLSSTGPLADTWSWNGSTWVKSVAIGPSARWGASMAFDAATHGVLLFGGKGASALLADTWIWNGKSWTSAVLTAPSPPARYRAAMAYDARTRGVVLFGGDSTSALGDMWTWSGANWAPQTVASPSPRYSASMVYDAADGELDLFGGTNGNVNLGDTWQWNGTYWLSPMTTASPSPRSEAALAYSSETNNAVLFGGFNGTSTYSDTWAFDVVASGPRNVRATSNANTQSVVTWSAPTSNGGSAILGYSVVASDTSTAANGGQSCATTTATTCTVTGLTNGDRYVFKVGAVNAVGPGSLASSNVAIPATAPQAPAISMVSPGAGQVIVEWAAPAVNGGAPIASYRVTANGNRGFCQVTAATTSCRITGLRDGAPYTFTMTASNAAGTSPRSAPSAVVKPRTVASSPVIVTKIIVGRAITIRWTSPVSNGGVRLTHYNVYVGRHPGGEGSRPHAAVSYHEHSYTLHGQAGDRYFLFVRAVNIAGVGPHSNQVGATARS